MPPAGCSCGGRPAPPTATWALRHRRRGEWDTLGDDGHLDQDGYLYLADRGSDRITRAGTSLYPAEVERVLEAHPSVRSALVVGAPHQDLGQRVHAVVDVADADVAPEALLAWTRSRQDPEKRVDTLEVVHEPLRDDAGKARRRDWSPGAGTADG